MSARSIERFLEILNYTTEGWGNRFEANSPLSEILRPDVVGKEAFLVAVAGSLGIEHEQIPQSKIHVETDTVETMLARLEESLAKG